MLKSKSFLVALVIACILLSAFASFGAAVNYTYDSLNRLTKVEYGNGSGEAYTYDAAGKID